MSDDLNPQGAPGAEAPTATPDEPIADEPMPQGDGATGDPDDDESDESDDAQVPYREDPHYRRVRNKNRNLQRRLKEAQPVLSHLRARGVKNHVQYLANLEYRARDAERIEQQLQRNPRLREAITGEAPQSRRDQEKDESFDPSTLPFDPHGGEVNRHLAQQAYVVHEMRNIIRAQDRRLRELEGGVTQDRRTRTEEVWAGATQAAMAQLPANVRRVFAKAVYGDYQAAARSGRKVHPQQVIDRYLQEIGAGQAATQRASQAAAQRLAERNQTLPRRPSGSSTPAPAYDRSKERLKDARARFLGTRAG